MTFLMTTEYRLVTERPGHQDGHKTLTYPKRNWEHARKGLEAHGDDMKRYSNAGLAPWHAYIETREVTKWERVDLEAKT